MFISQSFSYGQASMAAINTINPMNPQPNSRNPCNGSWHPSPPTNSSFLVFLNIGLQSSALRSDQPPTKPYHGYCQACSVQGHIGKSHLLDDVEQLQLQPHNHHPNGNLLPTLLLQTTPILQISFLIVEHHTMPPLTWVIFPSILLMTALMMLWSMMA